MTNFVAMFHYFSDNNVYRVEQKKTLQSHSRSYQCNDFQRELKHKQIEHRRNPILQFQIMCKFIQNEVVKIVWLCLTSVKVFLHKQTTENPLSFHQLWFFFLK